MRFFTILVVMSVIAAVPAHAQRDKVDIQLSFICYESMRGQQFKSPNGIFYYAKRQEIYVTDSGSHQIVIFDNKGTSVGRFSHMVDTRDGTGRIEGEPRGVTVNSKGDIFVTDNLANYVDLLDYRGRSIQKIYPKDYLTAKSAKVSAVQVTVDAEDNLYIAVSGDDSCILVLDKNLKLKQKVGKKGTEKGEFDSPSGVWVDSNGKIYVTDALGHPLQVFDKDGNVTLTLGDRGFGPMSFGLPSGCVTDKEGNIWVNDGVQNKVAVYNSKGGWLNNMCGMGREPGNVLYPAYMTGNGTDMVFVCERVGRRIQAFKVLFKSDKRSGEVVITNPAAG